MEFIYNEAQPVQEIVDAIDFLHNTTGLDGFWQGIAGLPTFTQIDDPSSTPAVISRRMRACTTPATVVHYTDHGSTATAYVTTRARFVIHMNMKYRRRSVASFVNTLAHEFVHVVDCFADVGGRNGSFEYGHSRKHRPERPDSAPYSIGRFAQQWWNWANQQYGEQLAAKLFAERMAEDFLGCGTGSD
jgi:hypothetical protein